MDKKQLISLFGIVSYLASQAAAQTIDELLYPLCKFDYDLMWIILVVAPAIVVFLLVYNGVKLQSDNENTRMSAKKGVKNAMIGLILIIAFSVIGCNFLPACVPCPLAPYMAPTDPTPGAIPLNVWIVKPLNGASFFVGNPVDVECKTRGAPTSIIWSFNDPYGKAPVVVGGTTSSYTYTVPGEYSIMVTAIDALGNTAQHKINVRIKAIPVPKPPVVGPAHCSNTVPDPGETDVDCGGSCPPCANGKKCSVNGDCISNWCNGGICDIGGACNDGIMNGGETGIDCGGPCPTACVLCSSPPAVTATVRFYDGATQVFNLQQGQTYTVQVSFTCSGAATPGAYNIENAKFDYDFGLAAGGSLGLDSHNCLSGAIGSLTPTFTVPASAVMQMTYNVDADIIDINGPQKCGGGQVTSGMLGISP